MVAHPYTWDKEMVGSHRWSTITSDLIGIGNIVSTSNRVVKKTARTRSPSNSGQEVRAAMLSDPTHVLKHDEVSQPMNVP